MTRVSMVPRERVTVWVLGELDHGIVAMTSRWLNAAEREQAEVHRRPDQRDRRIVTRGMLRHVIGRRLGVPPHEVALVAGPRGKPVVASLVDGRHRWRGTRPPIHVNATHTDGLSIVAVADRSPVGVDVEAYDVPLELELAPRICSAEELRRLADLDRSDAEGLLRQFWVRKESVAKADGRGLELDLRCIDVSAAPRVRSARRGRPMHVHDLDVGRLHRAAVAFSKGAMISDVLVWAPAGAQT